MKRFAALSIALSFLILACNLGAGTDNVDIGSFQPAPVDAGKDSSYSADAAPEYVDNGPKDIVDSGNDAEVDGGYDSGVDAGVDSGVDAGTVKVDQKVLNTYLCALVIPNFAQVPGTTGATNCSDANVPVAISYKLSAFDDGSVSIEASANAFSDKVSYGEGDHEQHGDMVSFDGNICFGGAAKDLLPGANGIWTFSFDLGSIHAVPVVPPTSSVVYTDSDLNGGTWSTVMSCTVQ